MSSNDNPTGFKLLKCELNIPVNDLVCVLWPFCCVLRCEERLDRSEANSTSRYGRLADPLLPREETLGQPSNEPNSDLGTT
jgi:hypothetical protein